MTQASIQSHRGSGPPLPQAKRVRVVATADLRRLHRLMIAIFLMQVINLAVGLLKLWR